MSQPASQISPNTTQFNLGERSRVAGGDYYEIAIPESIKTFLATTPSDVLDRLTQDNEDLFNYRFGFRINRSGRARKSWRSSIGMTSLTRKFATSVTRASCRSNAGTSS